MDQTAHIVKRDHGGDWKRYLDHSFRIDQRSTPPEELHQLHERWFADDVGAWIARMKHVQMDVDVLDQGVKKSFTYKILEEKRTCSIRGVPTTLEADIHARLSVDIQTSGVLTLIGELVSLLGRLDPVASHMLIYDGPERSKVV
jgi:chitinase